MTISQSLFADFDSLSLDDLNVVKAAKDLMLYLEFRNHGELGTLLDLERLVLEGLLASRGFKIDSDGLATRRLHGKRLDNADACIIGIRKVLASAKT